jgi:hypothetical protein
VAARSLTCRLVSHPGSFGGVHEGWEGDETAAGQTDVWMGTGHRWPMLVTAPLRISGTRSCGAIQRMLASASCAALEQVKDEQSVECDGRAGAPASRFLGESSIMSADADGGAAALPAPGIRIKEEAVDDGCQNENVDSTNQLAVPQQARRSGKPCAVERTTQEAKAPPR